ncbi:MAG TPA: DUF1614 domain-containing protein [Stellaceae bacterium]|nr:DUF1614 domain-containing protein [Stellaceae bacterium]
MRVPIWFSLLAALFLLILFPLLFAQVMAAGLIKLHLSPSSALLLIVGIFAGGMINIPVRRIQRSDAIEVHPLAAFGMSGRFPELRRVSRETIVAINVGGCVIPSMLALYEIAWLATAAPGHLWAAGVASLVNIAVCYALAQPVPGVGIAMPGLVPGLVAAALALVLAPEQAPAVAYIAGVTGPLIGADLLHLREIERVAAGVLSIGGAGTFDGIVLSGIVAAYLA